MEHDSFIRRGLMHFGKLMLAAVLCVVVSGCARTSNDIATSLPIHWTADKRVVLVDPDVELSELTFGGVAMLRADWTSKGRDLIKADIASFLRGKGIASVSADRISDRREAQLVKLHNALGRSIEVFLNEAWTTKKNNFDWTLGPGAAILRDRHHADYGLFVFVRDSYSSDTRKALALLTMTPTGATQSGFASLVDLRNGRVVWYNRLDNAYGGLRDEKSAAETVRHLLDGMPL